MEYGFIAGQCPHNEFLRCGEQDKCDRCGWNEAVAAERTKKILEEMGITPEDK